MFRVAVILFPGTNCEGEAYRSLVNAGLSPDYVRWNEREKLTQGKYDAFVLPGGFAYEDRSRAGIIAALDPVMDYLKEVAAAGKPVIGICNGCQVLVETGLIPGLPNNVLAGAVAMNTRVQGGKIIGTGYYNDIIYIQNVAPAGRSCMTTQLDQGATITAPVANGEGRFVFPADLLLELEKHNQILFKYCTEQGQIVNEFPVTPNGAVWGIAGFCNPAGNVVAYMPHPERLERNGESLFNQLRLWLEQPPKYEPYAIQWKPQSTVVEPYQCAGNCLQLYVDLIITDNAAKTVELALQQKGYQVTVSRKTHWEIWYDTDQAGLLEKVVETGELLNTNKERYSTAKPSNPQTLSFLVRYADDYEGKAVVDTLHNRFGLNTITNVRKGVVWELTFAATDPAERTRLATEILQTHILFNPFSQECNLIL